MKCCAAKVPHLHVDLAIEGVPSDQYYMPLDAENRSVCLRCGTVAEDPEEFRTHMRRHYYVPDPPPRYAEGPTPTLEADVRREDLEAFAAKADRKKKGMRVQWQTEQSGSVEVRYAHPKLRERDLIGIRGRVNFADALRSYWAKFYEHPVPTRPIPERTPLVRRSRQFPASMAQQIEIFEEKGGNFDEYVDWVLDQCVERIR